MTNRIVTPALGDLAYYAFRPAVYLIDAIWGTDMRHCDRCKERRARWNALPYSRAIAVTFCVTLCAGVIWWIAR